MAEKGDGYMFYNSAASNLSGIYRRDTGVDTLLGIPIIGIYAPADGTEFLMTLADGRIFVHEYSGSVWDWALIPASDSTYTAEAAAGVRTNRTGNNFDDFGGAELANTGWTLGSTVSIGTTHDVAWVGTSNLFADDGNICSATDLTLDARADELYIKGFSFSGIQSGDLVAGIEVLVQVTVNNDGPESPEVRLLRTTPVTTVQEGAATTGDIIIGNPTDNWGITWSATDFDSNFGVALSVQDQNGAAGLDFRVDVVMVRVWYVPGSVNASVIGVSAIATATNVATRAVRWPSTHVVIR